MKQKPPALPTGGGNKENLLPFKIFRKEEIKEETNIPSDELRNKRQVL